MEHYYILKEEYPNSPKIGTIINASMSEFYNYKPEIWNKFWKKEKFGEVVLTTEDNVEIKKGDVYFYVSETGIVSHNFAYNNMDKSKKYYCNWEEANKARIADINIQIENEVIRSEDVTLFGVLIKSNWEEYETSSHKVFYHKRSESWKYFRTKEERKDYIFENKPRFSFKDMYKVYSLGWNERHHNILEYGVEGFQKYIKENYE